VVRPDLDYGLEVLLLQVPGHPVSEGLVRDLPGFGKQLVAGMVCQEAADIVEAFGVLFLPQTPHGQLESGHRGQRTFGVFQDAGVDQLGIDVWPVEDRSHVSDGWFVQDSLFSQTHLGDEPALPVGVGFGRAVVDFPGRVGLVLLEVDIADAGHGNVGVGRLRHDVGVGPEIFQGPFLVVAEHGCVSRGHEKGRVFQIVTGPAFFDGSDDFHGLVEESQLRIGLEQADVGGFDRLAHGKVLDDVTVMLHGLGRVVLLEEVVAPEYIDHRHARIVRIFPAQQVEVALGFGDVAYGKMQITELVQGFGDVG